MSGYEIANVETRCVWSRWLRHVDVAIVDGLGMVNVATRWHRFCDAARDRRVRIFDGVAEGSLPFATEDKVRLDILSTYIEFMTIIPRFVVADEAIRLAQTDQALLSISDMITCNLLRLPFRECVVEFLFNGVTYSVLLRETDFGDGFREWEGKVFSYRDRRLNDDAAMIFPCSACLKVEIPDEPVFDTVFDAPRYPTFQCSVKADPLYRAAENDVKLIEEGVYIVFERTITAFCAAVLLPQTIGLSQTEVKTKASFNRARLKVGRSVIPKYTYIRVDTLRDAAGSVQRADGAGVAVHLRRAHKRRVAIGEGRTGRVWRFFPPQIVGYLPDGRKPSMPEMLATRGARPYLVK